MEDETYREECTGCSWRQTWADYWDDPRHPRRHGKMRLRYGNDAPWQYADYDEYGREILRIEQRNGTDVPGVLLNGEAVRTPLPLSPCPMHS